MIDMKISDMEKKEMATPSVLNDTADYPYGLRIHLDPESFKKLGIGVPKIGTKMVMECVVEVMSGNAETYKGDEKKYSCSLQITSMDVEPIDSGVSASEAIYGDD
jgi:hypothetical protein